MKKYLAFVAFIFLATAALAQSQDNGIIGYANGGSTGAGGVPGGATNTVQFNSAGTFGGVGPGTTTTVLHGNGSGAPSFGAVNLASDITGILPAANGGAGSITGILKANGSGTVSAASAGTDYAAPGAVDIVTTSPGATAMGTRFSTQNIETVTGASVTLAYPATTGLLANGANVINAVGGNVTITPNTGDYVCTPTCGSASASFTLTQGYSGILTTDQGGHLYLAVSVDSTSAGLVVGSTTVGSGTNGYIEYNNSGVLGELATTGTGSVVMAASAAIGLANGTGLPISTGVSGLGTGVATALGNATNGAAGLCVLGANACAYRTANIGWIAGVNPNNAGIIVLPAASTLISIVGNVETAVGSTATVSVNVAASGTACSGGTTVHSGSFNANGTAATNQTLTLTTTAVSSGNRLCLQTTGTTDWTGGSGIGTITVTYTTP